MTPRPSPHLTLAQLRAEAEALGVIVDRSRKSTRAALEAAVARARQARQGAEHRNALALLAGRTQQGSNG